MNQKQPSKISTNTKDSLQHRAEELAQLISRNNHQFNKGNPSQAQLSYLLEHTSECFDQLAFLQSQQASEQLVGTVNKQMHKQMSALFASSKVFFRNVNSWIGSFEVELAKKIKGQQVFENELAGFKNSCKMCHNHVEEIVLRQAKKEIIGPMNWRQLFDEELMNQKQQDFQFYETPDQKQYMSSVSYLNKVIKDMEQSVQGYENLAVRIEKDQTNTEQRTLRLLEQLVGKIKSKMGQRCLPKMQQILQKQLLRTSTIKTPTNNNFNISEQLSYCLGNSLKKSLMNRTCPSPQTMIQKLKEQNRRLTIEKNAATELYQTAQIYMNTAEYQTPHTPKQISNFARKNDSMRTEQIHTLPPRGHLNTLTTQQNETQNNRTSMNTESEANTIFRQKIQRIAMIPQLMKNKKGSMLVKRLSTFASQMGNIRRSELGSIFDRSLQETGYQPQLEEDEYVEGDTDEQEEGNEQGHTKDVGCQWDLNDLFSNHTIKDSIQSSAKYIRSSSKRLLNISLEQIPQKSRSNFKKESLKIGSPPKSSNANIRSGKKLKTKERNASLIIKDGIVQNDQDNQNLKENYKPSIFKQNQQLKKDQNKQQLKKVKQTKQYKKPQKLTQSSSKKGLNRQYGFNRAKITKLEASHSQTTSTHTFQHQLINSLSYSNMNLPNFDMQQFLNSDSGQQIHSQNIGLRKSTLGQLRSRLEKYKNLNESDNPNYLNGMLKGSSLQYPKGQRHTAGSLNRNGKKQNDLMNTLHPIIQHESNLDSAQQINSQVNLNEKSNIMKNPIFNQNDGISTKIRKINKKNNHIGSRTLTEGNDRREVQKHKTIRNFLFQAQHLILFGGLSQSYNYQQLPLPKNDEPLSESDKLFMKKMLAHLSNLKGFKRHIYENIVLFLKSPWQVIDKNECEFVPITNQILFKIVVKLMSYHKKKCSSVLCEHMKSFAQIIGLSY